MPESTQGEETEPPRRTWDRVPQRKLARRCQRRPATPKSKQRTRVAPTKQESKAFFNVDECDKGVLVAAEAQRVQKIEGHNVGTPAENALGRVEWWEKVRLNAGIDQVLEEFECARRERNRTIGIKGGGVTIALDDWDDEAGLPSGRNHSEAQDEVEEGKQK